MKRCHRFLSFILLLCWLAPAIAADATFGLEGGGSEGRTFQLDNSGIQQSLWLNGARLGPKAAVSIDLTCMWPSRPQFSPCPSIPTANISYSATSLRTELDSNGFITYAPNNLLLQSNTFSNAAWTASNATATANAATDPTGGNNAWNIATTANGGSIQQSVTFSQGANIYAAIYIKANSASTNFVLRLALTNGSSNAASISINASAGTINNTGTERATWATISPVGGGWYFVGMGFNSGGTSGRVQMYPGGGQGGFSSGSGNAYVYAAVNSTITYETSPRPGDQVITTSSAYYGPAFDSNYPSAGYQGLRIEEQRTNLALNNTLIAGASWTTFTQGGSGTVSRTANDGTAPDGSNNATLVTVNRSATTDGAGIFQAYTGTAANYTGTFYLKAFGAGDVGKQISLSAYDGTSATATSQLTLTSSWKPYSITHLTTASATANFGVGYIAGAGSQTGTVNFLVYYGQFELGSNATSVIPTGASAVTRSADIAQATGALAACYKAASESTVVEVNYGAPNSSSPEFISSTGNLRIIEVNASPNANLFDNGSTPQSLTAANSNLAPNNVARVGATYTSSIRAIAANGGVPSQDSHPGPSGATVDIGQRPGSAGQFIDGPFRKIACWSPALPNNLLQQKSVVGPGPITWLFPANENFAIDERRKAA